MCVICFGFCCVVCVWCCLIYICCCVARAARLRQAVAEANKSNDDFKHALDAEFKAELAKVKAH